MWFSQPGALDLGITVNFLKCPLEFPVTLLALFFISGGIFKMVLEELKYKG